MGDIIGNLIPIVIVVTILWSLLRRVLRGIAGSPSERSDSQSPARTPGETDQGYLTRVRRTTQERTTHAMEEMRQRVQGSQSSQETYPADYQAAQEMEAFLSGQSVPELPGVEELPYEAISLEKSQPAVPPEEVSPKPAAPPVPSKRRSRLPLLNSRARLRQAILGQQVLGPPKGLQPPGEE